MATNNDNKLAQFWEMLPDAFHACGGRNSLWDVELDIHNPNDAPTMSILKKFLKAHNGDVDAAFDAIKNSIRWNAPLTDPAFMTSKLFTFPSTYGHLGKITQNPRASDEDAVQTPQPRVVVIYYLWNNLTKEDENTVFAADTATFRRFHFAMIQQAIIMLGLNQISEVPRYDSNDEYTITQVHDFAGFDFRHNMHAKSKVFLEVHRINKLFPGLWGHTNFVGLGKIYHAGAKLMGSEKGQKANSPLTTMKNDSWRSIKTTSHLVEKYLPRAYGALPHEYGGIPNEFSVNDGFSIPYTAVDALEVPGDAANSAEMVELFFDLDQSRRACKSWASVSLGCMRRRWKSSTRTDHSSASPPSIPAKNPSRMNSTRKLSSRDGNVSNRDVRPTGIIPVLKITSPEGVTTTVPPTDDFEHKPEKEPRDDADIVSDDSFRYLGSFLSSDPSSVDRLAVPRRTASFNNLRAARAARPGAAEEARAPTLKPTPTRSTPDDIECPTQKLERRLFMGVSDKVDVGDIVDASTPSALERFASLIFEPPVDKPRRSILDLRRMVSCPALGDATTNQGAP
ncbi:hypothetical protein B0H63DRAFT_453750 [Podospora didyma]|uniref:Phosphatidylinositol transfer protein SFH5 n=1 Tax=Podospora didyma TaxID=330526 RepID=A0AAE0N6U3_9PEZI|nr:hypothetical protein B0H63DRAFT_453750 [Podospora didyma]